MLSAVALGGILNTEEAAKYWDARDLFLMRSTVTFINAIATGLKAYTSKEHKEWEEKRKNGNGNGNSNGGPAVGKALLLLWIIAFAWLTFSGGK